MFFRIIACCTVLMIFISVYLLLVKTPQIRALEYINYAEARDKTNIDFLVQAISLDPFAKQNWESLAKHHQDLVSAQEAKLIVQSFKNTNTEHP